MLKLSSRPQLIKYDLIACMLYGGLGLSKCDNQIPNGIIHQCNTFSETFYSDASMTLTATANHIYGSAANFNEW